MQLSEEKNDHLSFLMMKEAKIQELEKLVKSTTAKYQEMLIKENVCIYVRICTCEY